MYRACLFEWQCNRSLSLPLLLLCSRIKYNALTAIHSGTFCTPRVMQRSNFVFCHPNTILFLEQLRKSRNLRNVYYAPWKRCWHTKISFLFLDLQRKMEADGSIRRSFLQKTRPNFPQSEKVPAKNEEEPFCPAIRSSTQERQIVFYAIFQRSMSVRALGKPTRRSWLETNCSLGMRHVFPCELEMPSSSMVELRSCCAHVLREKKS